MKLFPKTNKNNCNPLLSDKDHSPSRSSKGRTPSITASTATTTPTNHLLQSRDNHVFCTVRPPWTWIMQEICETVNHQEPQVFSRVTVVDTYQDLPSGKLASVSTTAANGGSSSSTRTPRSRRRIKPSAAATMHTLRVDVVTNHHHYQHHPPSERSTSSRKWTLQSFHGTSEAFDGLEDKDEFVRTLQRCRCEHLELSPPSVLINWDASAQECRNLVGENMPALLGSDSVVGVLKEPMGQSGAGVFFVHSAEEIHEIMDRNRKRAAEEPGLLDALIAEKGRIPSWVLQAEVKPCLLIRDRRKFHVRTHVVCIENVMLDGSGEHQEEEDLMKLFIYDRHEIRIANGSVPEEETIERDRTVHIMDSTAERKLIREEPELLKRKLNRKCELFTAKIFSKHLRPDIERRIAMSASEMQEEDDESRRTMVLPHKFVVAGLDLLVTEDERIYLLEVNVNPSAPAAESVSPSFRQYLLDFQKDLFDLVTTRGGSAKWPDNRFTSTETILQRKLQQD